MTRLRFIAFLFSLLFSLALSIPTHALPVTFDLRAPLVENLDGSASLMLTSAGITATLSASVGTLNRTGSAFGIATPGCGNSDELDASCAVAESIAVTFNQAIELLSFSVSRLSRGDTGRFSVAPYGLSFEFSTNGVFDFATPVLLTIGDSFHIRSIADGTSRTGRGFSFDRFTVREPLQPTPIPVAEPSILMLLGCLAVAGCAQLRVRRNLGRGSGIQSTPEPER